MLLSLARLHIAGLHAWEWLHSVECVSWLEKYWHMVSCYPALPPSNAIGDQNNVRHTSMLAMQTSEYELHNRTGLSWAGDEAPPWNQIHLCHQPSSLRSPEECALTWWQMSSRSRLSLKSAKIDTFTKFFVPSSPLHIWSLMWAISLRVKDLLFQHTHASWHEVAVTF